MEGECIGGLYDFRSMVGRVRDCFSQVLCYSGVNSRRERYSMKKRLMNLFVCLIAMFGLSVMTVGVVGCEEKSNESRQNLYR